MEENNEKRTSIRFISPIVILCAGLALFKIDMSVSFITAHEITTIGIGLFSLGAFTFVILINDARNHILNKQDKISLSHVLVIYASLMTIAVYENLFLAETVAFTICVIMFIGVGLALLTDISEFERFDVVN